MTEQNEESTLTEELQPTICIPADGNERTIWVTDENGKRINFFNMIRYPSGTIVLLQKNVRVDFWRDDQQETYQLPCLATMLVFAPGSKDISESLAKVPKLESESAPTS